MEDVFGDMKDVTDMAGVEDMMAGVKGTTGAENGAEATKDGIRLIAGRASGGSSVRSARLVRS